MIDSLTIWLVKGMIRGLRLLGWHGSALPGLVAEKLRPSLLCGTKKRSKGRTWRRIFERFLCG